MKTLLILLLAHAGSPDAGALAHCVAATRAIGICHEGRGGLIFVNGGYSTRIGFADPRAYNHGGAVCQPGTSEPCEWAPAIMGRRPAAWPVMETELRGRYRYCLTKRPRKGHLPIGCLTKVTGLSFRRIDFDRDFGR